MDEKRENEIKQIEELMTSPDFWSDKERAKELVKRLQELKEPIENSGGGYDKGNAIVTIFSGAGGDDAEDFSRILLEMYFKYCKRKSWDIYVLHENQNDHGGYRNITFEIKGKGAYGTLKNESGVHRLVRISPFNAKKLRHTSFSMVEVIPKFDKTTKIVIPEDDLKVEFSRSSGPGGQNVNKRETAVRVVHLPTNIAVHSSSERSQAQNREKAMEILKGKLYKKQEEDRIAKEKGMYISKTMEIEWGNQMRSYVMHPYKMVKDHRTNTETSNINAILDGDLDIFIEAEKNL